MKMLHYLPVTHINYIYRPGSCVAPVSFTGTIQVAPNPTIDKDFIQANDVIDVM